MRGIANARFNMKADILTGPMIDTPELDPGSTTGHYEKYQDPDTGEIISIWVSEGSEPVNRGEIETAVKRVGVPCIVRAFLDTGYRTPANLTEYDKQELTVTEAVKMFLPARIEIGRNDRVTNIRTKRNEILWVEEHAAGKPATIFDVKGVNPIPDAFGRHIENMVILRRVPVQ